VRERILHHLPGDQGNTTNTTRPDDRDVDVQDTASGFGGEPFASFSGSGAATNRNVHLAT